ncbi:hypothetical protein CJ030_MR2G000193 [Morella rubra]|uniref:Uncharacterized protein n=1 Tax=Morella rubra TaxID=262757 RepID=A0A6A1WIN2_9ROSI|nr:hypothetical protein CJ030_MR2G000193 [Morella rubra]
MERKKKKKTKLSGQKWSTEGDSLEMRWCKWEDLGFRVLFLLLAREAKAKGEDQVRA